MTGSSLIPGFRFHPTDVELVMFYLKRKLLGKKITVKAVAEVNIYDFSPWDLPDKSALKSGDLEWYFFCPKTKKYLGGCRSSRSTENGFWKATGKDRQVSYNGRVVATIKTLVFHLGHAGKGQRTNWVMHEYKMEDAHLANAGIVQDMYVLCKVYEKSGSGPKNGAHYGKPFNEEEWGDDLATSIDSSIFGGLVGASDTMDNQQKNLATKKITEPGSSTVTSSSNRFTNIQHDKQKGPAAIKMTGPGSSIVTFNEESGADCIMSQMFVGANKATDDKHMGLATMNIAEPATTNMTEPGSSTVTSSSNRFTNIQHDKQKGPAAIKMTGPGSSIVTFNEEPGADCVMSQMVVGASNTTDDKQMGLATMNIAEPATTNMTEERGSSIVMFSVDQLTNTLNMAEPQTTHGDVMFLDDIDLPVADAVLSFNDDDVMFCEDFDLIMGSEEADAADVVKVKSSMVPTKDDDAFDGLVNLIDLDDLNEINFKTDINSYALDKLLSLDDLDASLGEFYVD